MIGDCTTTLSLNESMLAIMINRLSKMHLNPIDRSRLLTVHS